MSIGIFIFLVGLFSFLAFSFHFLLILLSFEFIVYGCFVLMCLGFSGSVFFMEMILFLVMMVCGGAFGLSILVCMSRGIGMDSILISEN